MNIVIGNLTNGKPTLPELTIKIGEIKANNPSLANIDINVANLTTGVPSVAEFSIKVGQLNTNPVECGNK